MTQAVPTPRIISGLGAPEGRPAGTSLPMIQLDRRTYDRSLDCVHCGLCLPACPTYTQNGLEADSPRGRIYLMKGLADGKIGLTDSVIEHLDLCLNCRACETACPSGVVYHELIEETRALIAPTRRRGPVDRIVDAIFFRIFPYPTRVKFALLPARILQKLGLWRVVTSGFVGWLLPARFEKMQQMLPPTGPLWETRLARQYPARAPDGVQKAVVGMFTGCIGSVLFQPVNRQTVSLLQHAGCEVLVHRDQGCCGAILHHGGRLADAEKLARANIDAFLSDGPDRPRVDFIVNNIAGCGAMLKDYPHLLRDDPEYAQKAEEFTRRVRDISELLSELEMPPPDRPIDLTAVYHDACHLAHVQKITAQPRRLLGRISGLELLDLPESEMCCGAAGTYNLSQPAMARELAERKIAHIQKTGARTCVTGNVGCAMQIKSEADRLGVALEVVHPVSLLHEAYFGGAEGSAGPA